MIDKQIYDALHKKIFQFLSALQKLDAHHTRKLLDINVPFFDKCFVPFFTSALNCFTTRYNFFQTIHFWVNLQQLYAWPSADEE